MFMQILNNKEQKRFRMSPGLSEVIYGKFKLHHNETILPLQYCKLTKE